MLMASESSASNVRSSLSGTGRRLVVRGPQWNGHTATLAIRGRASTRRRRRRRRRRRMRSGRGAGGCEIGLEGRKSGAIGRGSVACPWNASEEPSERLLEVLILGGL